MEQVGHTMNVALYKRNLAILFYEQGR